MNQERSCYFKIVRGHLPAWVCLCNSFDAKIEINRRLEFWDPKTILDSSHSKDRAENDFPFTPESSFYHSGLYLQSALHEKREFCFHFCSTLG